MNVCPSVFWCCWFGDRKGIQLVKSSAATILPPPKKKKKKILVDPV